ncbi:MAG: hypothetical protein PHI12_06780 [Dehalococcoidales bacterium]|nr:hypothetical protein [Dehalococcoidales bacterium]
MNKIKYPEGRTLLTKIQWLEKQRRKKARLDMMGLRQPLYLYRYL